MATPCGYQQITNVSAAVGLTLPTTFIVGANQKPTYCLITPQTQAVRWRDDGVDPSATVGYPLAAGVELRYNGDLNKIKFFAVLAAIASIVGVSYYY